MAFIFAILRGGFTAIRIVLVAIAAGSIGLLAVVLTRYLLDGVLTSQGAFIALIYIWLVIQWRRERRELLTSGQRKT